MADQPEKSTGTIVRGISFSLEDWDALQVAIQNGYKRSSLVAMGLEALKRDRPDIFLRRDYTKVIIATPNEPTADAA